MANEQQNLDPHKKPICARCGVHGAVVILPATNQFYCLPCLQYVSPLLYLQLSNWVEDHPPRNP